MKLNMYDALMICFSFVLTLGFGIFFGCEVSATGHERELKHASKVINDCNYKKMAGTK